MIWHRTKLVSLAIAWPFIWLGDEAVLHFVALKPTIKEYRWHTAGRWRNLADGYRYLKSRWNG